MEIAKAIGGILVEILKQIAKLIDVKTIVTFSLVGTVIFLAVTGKVESQKAYELALIVVTYYFVKQKTDEQK